MASPASHFAAARKSEPRSTRTVAVGLVGGLELVARVGEEHGLLGRSSSRRALLPVKPER